MHSPFLDSAMVWATNAMIWLPFFILLLYLTIRSYRWKTIMIVFSVALMITASDQLANLSKHHTEAQALTGSVTGEVRPYRQ